MGIGLFPQKGNVRQKQEGPSLTPCTVLEGEASLVLSAKVAESCGNSSLLPLTGRPLFSLASEAQFLSWIHSVSPGSAADYAANKY